MINKLPVRAHEMTQRNAWIPDSDLTALSDQPLAEPYLGALPQVVRARLETQSQQRDLFLVRVQDCIRSALNVLVVAEHYGFEEWQPQVKLLGTMFESSQIFGET